MATSAANIFVGAGNIFLGKTGTGVLPTSGTPPTIFAHTAGVPSGAQTGYTHIGHTEGDATFTYKATKTEITSEQNLAPVDVFVVT